MTTQNWQARKIDSQKRRAQNRKSSRALLEEHGFPITVHTEAHLTVFDRFDFWPGTGKYKDRKGSKYKRGVFNLLKDIKRAQLKNEL